MALICTFPDGSDSFSIVAKTATKRNMKEPTGYAVIKRNSKLDSMIVRMDKNCVIRYVSRIADKDAPAVVENFIRISILSKVEKPKFTVSGTLKNGKNCTLGKFLGNIEFGENNDSNIITHHLSGDPTNNNGWNLARERRDKHGSFHGSLGRTSSEEDIRRVALTVGDDQMKAYYCSENVCGHYKPRTFEECEAENAQDYFSSMRKCDYDDLMDAIRQEIRNSNK